MRINFRELRDPLPTEIHCALLKNKLWTITMDCGCGFRSLRKRIDSQFHMNPRNKIHLR
jgi:anti-sigma regulatory factor (Ser/Thr protein kinase)